MKKGIFLTFEGIDGAGKTTKVEFLKNYLEKKGYRSTFIKGNFAFEGVKEKVIDMYGYIDPIAVFLLTMSKHKVIAMEVEKLLLTNDFVVVDRYIDTSIAYSLANIDENLKFHLEKTINELVPLFLIPDYTFFVDTTANVALNRKKGLSFDKIEFGNKVSDNLDKDIAFLNNQNKAYNNYLSIFRNDCRKVIKVDGLKDIYQSNQNFIESFKSVFEQV